MQAEDNGFYLNRGELREFSTWGCYYADCRDHLSSREVLDEFIDRILIYELDKDTNTRKIEIYYSFVGQVNSGETPTESVSFFRQIGADVKSYAV